MVKHIAVVFAVAALTAGVVTGGPASAATPSASSQSTATFVAPGSGTPLLEQSRQALARKTGVAPQVILCWANITIRAHANGLYVSTEVGERGVLRARASVVGPWERYSVCRDTVSKRTSIRAQVNAAYVSTEIGERGILRARGSQIGPWEYYYTSGNPNSGGTTVFHANANGLYVSTEIGERGILRARASQIGPWEVYSW